MAWIHRRMREEEGISLVEVLVSIVLMGLVLSALAMTLMSSMASARQVETTTKGTAIATETLENLQALPWAQVGFYGNDTGYTATATVDGSTLNTVQIAATAPVPRPAAVPKPLVTRNDPTNNKAYTVRTYIVWKTVNRYKFFRVEVEWRNGTQLRTVRLEGRRARRPVDAGAGTIQAETFRIKAFTVTPDPVMLSATGKLEAATTPVLESNAALLVEIETSKPALTNSVVATYEPSKSVTLTEVAGSGGLKWRGLVAPDAITTYYSKLITFTGNAREASTNAPAPPDVTAAVFLRPYSEGPSYVIDQSTRTLTYPNPPVSSSPDRLCIPTSGNPANAKPLVTDTWVYFALGGLEPPDAVAGTPGDTVTLTRIDAGSPYTLPLTHFVYQGTEYWRGLLPSSGSGRPTFVQDTVSQWELSWSRSLDGQTWPIRPVRFYINTAAGSC